MLKKILFVFLFPFLVNGQSAQINGGSISICDNGIPAEVIVNFSGQAPFSFTFAINGVIQPQLAQLQDDVFIISTKVGGVYTLTQFNDNINVGTTDGSVIVNVLESPTAIISSVSDTLSVLSPEVNYNSGNSIGNFNALSYHWIFGDGYFGGSEKVTHKYPIDSDGLGIIAVYQDLLIVTDLNGCSDTAVNQIFVRDEYWIYIPNSFTPDYDKKNDKFCIEYHAIREKTFLFKVFNSQGDLIYQSSNPSEMKCSDFGGWDGKHFRTKKNLPLDTYIYEMYFQDFEGWKHQEYGEINLVR